MLLFMDQVNKLKARVLMQTAKRETLAKGSTLSDSGNTEDMLTPPFTNIFTNCKNCKSNVSGRGDREDGAAYC